MKIIKANAKKVIFLDRDGTINIDYGYVHRLSDWKFTSNAPNALRKLVKAGYTLTIVSNQAGVADGRFSEADVISLHNHMNQLLESKNVSIDAIAFCTHHRDSGCNCRKPKPAMAKYIEAKIGTINYDQSWVIGDKVSDIEFGKNIGTKTALIRSKYWTPSNLGVQPDQIVNSLSEFANNMIKQPSSFDQTNWRNEKFLTASEAITISNRLHIEGRKLVTTNGSFDLLHAGHLDQLEEAKKQGDVLFVGVNTDNAISTAKGANRPLIPEEARMAMLAALTCVDYVVLMPGTYEEEPMLSLIECVRPHIQVNGPDYGNPETWTEWPTMQKYNTKGFKIEKRNNFSTTNILNRIIRSVNL